MYKLIFDQKCTRIKPGSPIRRKVFVLDKFSSKKRRETGEDREWEGSNKQPES